MATKAPSPPKKNGKLDFSSFMDWVSKRNHAQPEFLQAVHEVAEKVIPFVNRHPQYLEARILQRMTEPDRCVTFRVTWEDDERVPRINRGFRVQFNNAIGPYKGGLRFARGLNLSILKFLGFEQVLKNSLTTLPMGGAKGGSDFDPKGKSDHEVMRFCQAFMTELQRHIGQFVDVPAGDIGVGAREIGFLFGQYRRVKDEFAGVLTGKGIEYGGIPIRPEATGYGSVYFAGEMLATRGMSLEGMTCAVSGSGNVSLYTAEKLIELGAKVVTLSDSDGFVHDPDGLTPEKLDWVMELKNARRGRIKEYADAFGLKFFPGQRPWKVPCDAAFPSATQNELDADDARALVKNGCKVVSEGANMPTTNEGVRVFEGTQLLYGPGKAANAGGVSVSGLEMSENSMRIYWKREEVDAKLREIMKNIHAKCVEYGRLPDGRIDYVKGANIGGFVKVAEAMVAYGTV